MQNPHKNIPLMIQNSSKVNAMQKSSMQQRQNFFPDAVSFLVEVHKNGMISFVFRNDTGEVPKMINKFDSENRRKIQKSSVDQQLKEMIKRSLHCQSEHNNIPNEVETRENEKQQTTKKVWQKWQRKDNELMNEMNAIAKENGVVGCTVNRINCAHMYLY